MKHLRAYRDDTLVFDDVSFTIPDGQHTVILGPNGCGKSTLLKLLTREVYPVDREGSVFRLFGKEQWNVWDLRRQLGIVSSEIQQTYDPTATGLEVILSGYYASVGIYVHQPLCEVKRRQALELMRDLGIAELADRPYRAMSTGEQRRCLLGRAVIHDPRILVLDEPTTGLDVKAAAGYLRGLRRLLHQGKTLILVTHHLHEIPADVSHVVLLKQGRILAQGKKADLMTSECLSDLFDAKLTVVESDGLYHVSAVDA